jgi:hypothetical protein
MAEFTKNILRKQGRPTGEGKVTLEPNLQLKEWPWTSVEILLHNYNTDGNLLKVEHKAWLKAQLAPFLQQQQYHAVLKGTASSPGSTKYNKQISWERVLLLKEFLIEKCSLTDAQVPGSKMTAVGERFANVGDQEHDRAVQITLLPGRVYARRRTRRGHTILLDPSDWPLPWPHGYGIEPGDIQYGPLPPPSKWEPPQQRRRYKIRYISGIKGAYIGATEIHVMEITDVEKNKSAQFQFVAGGAGLKGGSVTPPQRNQPAIVTSNAQTLADFQGRETVLTSAGFIGSVSYLAILGTDPTNLDTGYSIEESPGASVVVGRLEVAR